MGWMDLGNIRGRQLHIHGRLENNGTVPASGLGTVQGDIGGIDEFLLGLPISREGREPDAEFCRFSQSCIAGKMTADVVVFLEVVYIDEHHCKRGVAPLAPADFFIHSLFEKTPVVQSGQ